MTSRLIGTRFFLPQGHPSLAAQCGLLSLAIAVVFLLVAVFSFFAYGWRGVLAASLAAASCWLAGLLGTVVSELLAGSVYTSVLTGMGFRMAIPLGSLLAVWALDPTLLHEGFIVSLAACYFVMLVLETLFACSRARATDRWKGSAQHG